MSSFRKAGKSFYKCRDNLCKVRITVNDDEDLISDVRVDHEHDNRKLEAIVNAKVKDGYW